ncbi:MAG: SDR family NAD(P)-dependent oxidoreductase [Chloroflexi bacterium]|nr:SDR family NAD(P)-dependent oxidoreductase [Chloroflexota bacterium]
MPSPVSTRVTSIARRFFPWVVVDLPLVWACYALALLVRGATTDLEYEPALLFGFVASVIVVAWNEAFGIYRRWWRFATSQDMVPLTVAVGCSTVTTVGLSLAWPGVRPMPLSVVFLGGFFALCGMTAARYRAKPLAAIRRFWRRLMDPPNQAVTRVLIVGAGDAGQQLGWQLQNGTLAERHHVVGYVDDDRRKHGMLIHSRKVLGGRAAIPDLIERHQIDLIVLAIHRIAGRDFRDIVALCQETSAQIKVVPDPLDTIRGEVPRVPSGAATLFGDVTLEDLLGRRSVTIDREQCRDLVRGKVVLVTGAAGSIGSELCRQLADLRPARLLMLDVNESGVHDLAVELQGYRSDDTAIVPVVGDVTHEARLRAMFARERPRLVFHAAAYKHVPLMEEYPEEAVRVNVGGTRLMLELAAAYPAERFVLVSSDKAVEPSSVMGATKRVCELLGGAMPPSRTRYTAVRFGNVLASRGSVVPTFRKQIDMGGPVTITDPNMSRYFMSIGEASSLIIQAASFTSGNDVFLLDMGEELNVAELARRMIRLRGLRPDVDIPIVVTGPRPGEKLREVLHSVEEYTEPTPHRQVLRVLGQAPMTTAALGRAVDDLMAAALDGDRAQVRRLLWAVARDGVPPTPISVPAVAGARPSVATAPIEPVPNLWPTTGGAPRLLPAGTGAGRHAAASLALPEPRAPLYVFGSRLAEAGRAAVERLIALEPWYVPLAAAALLAHPTPLTWPALVLAMLPWLLRLVRTGRLAVATPFDISLLLFVAGAGLGLLVSSDVLWAGVRLTGIVAGVALYSSIVHHATDIPRLKRAFAVIVGVALVGSVLLLLIAAPFLPWMPGTNRLDGLVGATDGLRQLVLGPSEALERYRFRASGVGALATFGLALSIGPALAAARPSSRLAGLGLAGFFGLIVLASGNRGSLVSVVALGIVILGLRYGWLFLTAVPVVLVGLWAVLERDLFGMAAPDAVPLSVKVQFWKNAGAMLHDFAFTGAGLGLRPARDVYEAYFLAIGPSFSHAHNAYIQAYLEQGVLGCVGLVSLTLILFFYARRTVASARLPLAWGIALSGGGAAIVLLFEGLTEVVLLTSVGTVMLLLALGLLVAAARLRWPPDDETPAVRRGTFASQRTLAVATPVVGLMVGAAVLAFTVTPLSSSLFLNLGAAERTRAVLSDDLDPNERRLSLERAASLLRRGLAADDSDPALWRNLAEVASAQGEPGEVRTLLRAARDRTDVDDGYGLYQLGRIARDAGFWQEAVRAWRQAGAVEALLSWNSEARDREQWDRSRTILLAIAELRPRDRDVFRQFVDAGRHTRGGIEPLVRDLEYLSETLPASPWPSAEAARLYDELGRSADAEAARQEALRRGAPAGSL